MSSGARNPRAEPSWVIVHNRPDGSPAISITPRGEGYLVRSHDVADFVVSADGVEIRATPEPGVPASLVETALEQHVRPLVQQLLRRPALHASAVASPMGVVAFIGPSGSGKSTLAALLASTWPLAADDYLPVELSQTPLAIPTATSLNLRPDSGRHLAPDGPERAGKVVLDVRHASAPTPLAAVYSVRPSDAATLGIAGLSTRDAVLTLAAELHRLDPRSPDLLRAELDHLHTLAVSVRVARLSYPRRFDVGPEVIAAITEDLQGFTGARARSRE